MGFHNLWGKAGEHGDFRVAVKNHVYQGLGSGGVYSPKTAPSVRVEMISNFSKVYHKPRLGWWARWTRRLGIL